MHPPPPNRVCHDPGEDPLDQRVILEQKLQKASQWLSPDEFASSTEVEIKCALATAELYRLATLLYLQRVVPAEGDDTRRITYLQQAFAALAEVRVATSPWPVFVVACESRTDEERIHILEILDRMDRLRNVGNFIALDEDKCHFTYQLVNAMGATNIIEAGTSFGVSTIYLALAVGKTTAATGKSGIVIATEKEPEKALMALWSVLALPTLKTVLPHLRHGAVVLTDNTISGAEGYKDLLAYLREPRNGFQNMTLPFTNGFEMSVYLPKN
ncbi:O-methyltransferase [Colletotrichum karsti]|uniref:O-methyltransferase n=1 Tax=Colletotrichum karsti TaxID=1095194 RepID=A0A9P6IB23_9PEZI|nr:O-methyltransferase [Colletotrichum karsti]KAF9877266.1 O-methyltransferase [Colletotrichum karsti]